MYKYIIKTYSWIKYMNHNLFEYIEFTDDLKIGIDLIDSQHKEIIRIYNMFVVEINQIIFTAMHLKNDSSLDINESTTLGDIPVIAEEAKNLIDVLVEYVTNHFNDEEQLMQQFHYSEFEKHSQKHVEIKDEILYYKDAMHRNELSIIEFVEFFYGWVINHIKNVDVHLIKEYKDFIEHNDHVDHHGSNQTNTLLY